MIELRSTDAYPTRYQAFDSPGILWEAGERKNRGGFEAAVFWFPVGNSFHPDLNDGVYGEVVSYQGSYWIANIAAYRPDANRTQRSWRFQSPDYEEARGWLRDNIRVALIWATGSFHDASTLREHQ